MAFIVQIISTSRFGRQIPCGKLHGRIFRTRISQIQPFVQDQSSKISELDCKRFFLPENLVFTKSFVNGPKWMKGKVVKRIGKMLYLVKVHQEVVKRHINQLRVRYVSYDEDSKQENAGAHVKRSFSDEGFRTPTRMSYSQEKLEKFETPPSFVPSERSVLPRKSTRIRKPPDRYCP